MLLETGCQWRYLYLKVRFKCLSILDLYEIYVSDIMGVCNRKTPASLDICGGDNF